MAAAAHSSAPFSWSVAQRLRRRHQRAGGGTAETRNYRAAGSFEGRKGRQRTPLGARLTSIVSDAAYSL